MKKFFCVAGLVTILLGAAAFLALLLEPIIAVVTGFSLVLSGVLMMTVGSLIGRVSYLESRIGLRAPSAEINPELPQRRCVACGKQFDFDFPRCPYCDHPAEASGRCEKT